MSLFNLIVDRKVELWRRDKVEIEADTIEEAARKAINEDYDGCESEYLNETEEPVEDNEDRFTATVEVMDDNYTILLDNHGYSRFRNLTKGSNDDISSQQE